MTRDPALIDETKRWPRYAAVTVLVVLMIGMGIGGWMVYFGISTSLQAERNLHATRFAICLVDQFVHDKGQWPKSWHELEKLKFPRATPSPLNVRLASSQYAYKWPAAAGKLQERVAIDFQPDVRPLLSQSSMKFAAIKPIGPCYEYRDYGDVQSLQKTLANALQRDRQRDQINTR